MEDFARLEKSPVGQVLATLRSTGEGPTIEVSISPRHGVYPLMRLGPWPESKQGWDEAERAFKTLDLQGAARDIAKQTDQMIDTPEGSPLTVATIAGVNGGAETSSSAGGEKSPEPLMLYEVKIIETIQHLKTCDVMAADEGEARRKAEAGDFVFERLIKQDAVLERRAGSAEMVPPPQNDAKPHPE